ncbi:MAG: hypothetical protein AB4368_33200 [Xenococcaceae cyanobacterium]
MKVNLLKLYVSILKYLDNEKEGRSSRGLIFLQMRSRHNFSQKLNSHCFLKLQDFSIAISASLRHYAIAFLVMELV